MKKITLDNNQYELIDNYKDGFELDDLKEKYTDYFEPYDYIFGDYAYGKLRLKGFCNKDNKIYNKINDVNTIKDYIKDYCAYDCRYFVIKKEKN